MFSFNPEDSQAVKYKLPGFEVTVTHWALRSIVPHTHMSKRRRTTNKKSRMKSGFDFLD